jgi:hypothetical protein
MLSSNVTIPRWLRMCMIVWFALAPKSNKQLGRVEHIPCISTIIQLSHSQTPNVFGSIRCTMFMHNSLLSKEWLKNMTHVFTSLITYKS